MNKTLAFIIALSFLLRLIIAVQPIDTLVQKIILDDSFYYFSEAKGLATGHGITSNSYDPTNGLHPLYLFTITPLFTIGNLNLSVNLVLFLAAVIDIISLLLIYKIAKKFLSEKLSIVTTALYGLNPLIAFTMLSGIDVVLAVFMATIVFYSWICKNNSIIVGILLGIGLLARTDIVLLALPLITFEFFRDKKRAVSIVAISIIVFSPWLIWSFVNFGTIQQSSAIANYLHAHEIFEQPQPSYSFIEWLKHGIENFVKFFTFTFHFFGAIDYSIASFVLGGIAIYLAAVGFFHLHKALFIPLVYGFLILLFYSFYLWSFGPRYIAPLIGFICIAISSSLNWLAEKVKFKALFPSSIVIFVLIFFVAGAHIWERGYFPWQAATLDEVNWIKENTNPNDAIGSFNSGIITYFSKNKVVNLDGIVNFKAIDAIRNKSVYNYMKSENISYWVDMDLFPPEVFDAQETFDIAKENRWKNVLGNGSENLKLLEQKFYTFKNLRGNNITIVRFMFEVN